MIASLRNHARTLGYAMLGYAVLGAVATFALGGEPAAVRGYWLEPSGSVIRIERCDGEDKLCIQIVALPPGPHPTSDVHNPDVHLRDRPLCGLVIGREFTERDPRHATGGYLYDPRSGRTYRGSLTAKGDRLELRGYVGVPLFGRTQTWTRTHAVTAPCEGG